MNLVAIRIWLISPESIEKVHRKIAGSVRTEKVVTSRSAALISFSTRHSNLRTTNRLLGEIRRWKEVKKVVGDKIENVPELN